MPIRIQYLTAVVFYEMTTAERDAIATVPDYLVIQNTTVNRLQMFVDEEWVDFAKVYGSASDEDFLSWDNANNIWVPKTPAETIAILSSEAAAAFDMNSQKITGLTAGAASGEAVEYDQLHAQAHAVASHSDTTATGTELETLTDGSDADTLHDHATFVTGAEAVSAVATADPYLKNNASDETNGTITAAGFTTTGIATLQAVAIDSTPANDTCSGVTAELTAGAALTRGDFCYQGADGKMEKALATAEATSRVWAVVEEATIAENATGTFLLHGFFEKEWNFGTVGAKIYLSDTSAGAHDETAPADTDECIVILGIAYAADCLYFDPTLQAIVEHT